MHSIDSPDLELLDFYDDILKGRHDNLGNKYLRTRLIAIKSTLINEEKRYVELANSKKLHLIKSSELINLPSGFQIKAGMSNNVNSEEMKRVYNEFLVESPDSEKIGREIYNEILANTESNLCPYCSHREVKTLDHYFPKSHFSLYAVTPINLLPCCADCNKDKLDKHSVIENKLLLHPYFDDVSEIEWLECEVERGTWPITFSFKVKDNIKNKKIKSRIIEQFDMLKLSKLYADNATREFSRRVKSIVKEFNCDRQNKALDFIKDNVESYSQDNINSWQTLMFIALRDSDWFLNVALPDLEQLYIIEKRFKKKKRKRKKKA